MEFFIYLVIMIVMMIISDLTRPVPKSPKRPGLGDFQVPTADASRKVPVIWGKPMLRGPNVTWYGNLSIKKIIKKVKGVFVDKEYTAGYKYSIGLHMAWCVSDGEVRLLRLQVGDDDVLSGNFGPGRIRINKPELWGGDESEGGISGELDFCAGGSAQGQNDYLASRVSSRIPAYRSTARIVWRGGYLGTSKYIKEWAAQLQRLPSHLGNGRHNINGEANPAEMLYEMLLNKHWGLGCSNLDIETQTFLDASVTLYNEAFGLSMVWDGAKTLRAIADDVLSHIDALLFVNVLTGKWELRLNRAATQAEIDAAPTFSEEEIKELESYSRPSLDETTNEVNVIWTEDGDTTTWPAKAQDLGLFQVHDKQFVSVDVTYQGVTSYELAQKLATRDLRTLSYPMVKVSFKMNRQGYDLKPGSRFKFKWTPLEIQSIVMVIVGIDYGTLDDNLISIDAVQDVFALGTGLYSGGGGSGWIAPSRNPLPPTLYRMLFTPYWLMKLDPNIGSPETAIPMLLVEAPSETQISYDISYSDPTMGGSFAAGPAGNPFTPTGVVVYDYLESTGTDTSGTLIINALTGTSDIPAFSAGDIQYLAEGLMMIEDEWMAVGGATMRDDGSVVITKVYRGLLDSTISRHLAGSKVWFVSLGVGRTPTELYPFAAGTYRAKLISRALGGLLDEAAAPTVSISTNATTTNARPLYPYPPRDLTLNGSRVPLALGNVDLTVSWKERNRATEEFMYFQDTPAIPTKETGVYWKAYLYSDAAVLLQTSPDLTTTSHTFATAGTLPAAGYVVVRSYKTGIGTGQSATIWFGLAPDYSGNVDQAPQKFLADADPWMFLRMAD